MLSIQAVCGLAEVAIHVVAGDVRTTHLAGLMECRNQPPPRRALLTFYDDGSTHTHTHTLSLSVSLAGSL